MDAAPPKSEALVAARGMERPDGWQEEEEGEEGEEGEEVRASEAQEEGRPLLEHTHPLLKRPLLAVAPMIDVTNRHFRMLIRCISDLPVLWTEMTWDRAILYNTPDQPEHKLKKTELERSLESIIGFSEAEQPLVMQLGGCDPDRLARAARLADGGGLPPPAPPPPRAPPPPPAWSVDLTAEGALEAVLARPM